MDHPALEGDFVTSDSPYSARETRVGIVVVLADSRTVVAGFDDRVDAEYAERDGQNPRRSFAPLAIGDFDHLDAEAGERA